MWKQLPATVSVIGLNVLIFLLAAQILPPENVLVTTLPLYFPKNDNFGIWQFVTHMFMHGSTTHLFMNMFGLFSFGSILERIWGVKRFLIFYFVAGIGAAILYTLIHYVEFQSTSSMFERNGIPASTLNQILQAENPEGVMMQSIPVETIQLLKENIAPLRKLYNIFNLRMVGASGAIYGVLTAFGLLFPNAKLSLIFLPVPIAAKFFIPALLLLDFFSGITGFSIFGGGIAHFAHLGGALIGFLLMVLWRKDVKPEVQPLLYDL